MRLCEKLTILGALIFILALACSCGGSDDDSFESQGDDAEATDDAQAQDDAVDDTSPKEDYSNRDDFTVPFDPSKKGPFAVGNRTFVYIDESRDDWASHGKRTLNTEVWYPAEDWTRKVPRDHIYNFLGNWVNLVESILRLLVPPEEMQNFNRETGSARDVPMYRGAGPYPLVLFSHGNAGIRFQDMTLAEHLASHGYVVVAPDHIGNAVFVTLPDRISIYNPILLPWSFTDRLEDLSFLIDKITELNAYDPDAFFTDMINLDKVAEIGHSFGAVTVTSSGQLDRRVKAVVEMAGFEFPVFPPNFRTPYYYMVGLEDHTMGDYTPLTRFDFSQTDPPAFWLEFINGGHYTFTDACILIPTLMGEGDGCGSNTHDNGEPFDYIPHDEAFHVLNTYITSFLGFILRDQHVMAPILQKNIDPDQVNINYKF